MKISLNYFNVFFIAFFFLCCKNNGYANPEMDFSFLLLELMGKEDSDICLDTIKNESISGETIEEKSVKRKEFDAWKNVRSNTANEAFQNYIERYFTKTFPATERFLINMNPEDLAQEFDKLVTMITYQPWIYVEQLFRKIEHKLSDDQKKTWENLEHNLDFIKKEFCNNNVDSALKIEKWMKSGGGCWEFISDQLGLYHQFLDKAVVGSELGIIYFKKSCWDWSEWDTITSFMPKKDVHKSESLKKYWENRGIFVHHNFYALCFDYFAKLFLEAILSQQRELADQYYYDLKITVENLSGTKYESDRQETFRRYKELLELLKRKQNGVSEENHGTGQYLDEMMEMLDMD